MSNCDSKSSGRKIANASELGYTFAKHYLEAHTEVPIDSIWEVLQTCC